MELIKNSIKKYVLKWNVTRIFQLLLGGTMLAAYLSNHDTMYLFLGTVLTLQAVLGIGCLGGSCGTSHRSSEEPKIKFDKYKPRN